jgi:hypothetical protein
VTRDFHTVLARIAAGSAEDTYQDLVDDVLVLCYIVGLNDVAIMDGVGLGVGEVFGEDVRKNLKRLGS